MKLKDSVALVTGGASGLGEACVLRFAEQGAKVVIADLNEEAGKKLASKLGKAVLFSRTDVTDEKSVQEAIDLAVQKFGGLHILVNCAGIGTAAKLLDKEGNPTPLSFFDKIIRINLLGSINCARLAAAAMSKNKPSSTGERGILINTASIAAFEGQIGQVGYSASKGGVVSMALPMARELARMGVRVNTISPGIFETPMLGQLEKKIQDALGAMVPFPNRLGKPEEYALLAQHLVENEMINGEVIRIDGAMRMASK